MPFKGFGPQALPFFKALAFHQTKEWFEQNRAIYEGEVRDPFGDLIDDLSAAFAKAKLPLKGDRKGSLFRLNRDIRFSKDKSPYKTNSGAVLSRTGAKNDPGMLYVHVSAEGCFAAAGFWQPEPDALARLRAAVARAPKAWKTMVAKLANGGLALEDEHAIKRAPRGYETLDDPEIAAAVRNTSFICSRDIADARLASPKLVDDVVAFAHDAMPLLKWGWGAVVDARGDG